MSTKKVILSILMLLCISFIFTSTNKIDITVPNHREAPAETTIRVVASPVETEVDYTGIPYMHRN